MKTIYRTIVNYKKKVSQPNSMKKKSPNPPKIVSCGECTELKYTNGELLKRVSAMEKDKKNDTCKFEELFNEIRKIKKRLEESDIKNEESDIKNEESDIKIEELQEQNEELHEQLAKSNIKMNKLEYNDKINQRDMIDILRPLRTRQLIEAGRKLFYTQWGTEYRRINPTMVSKKTTNSRTTPTNWEHFIEFVKSKNGDATYWHLLVGGGCSEFGNTSATIHNADKYIIAKYFKKVGTTPRDYGDLFKKVFSSTVNDVCPN